MNDPIASSSNSHRPAWQLPPGVSRGTWDYCRTPAIATEYDQFHGAHPLLDFDQGWIATQIERCGIASDGVGTILDLGCGTGRAMVPWYAAGWRTIGLDLSPTMLEESQLKLSSMQSVRSDSSPGLIHGNLAQLECLASETIDVAVCLYSSIGMVRGREHRINMIQNVKRSLRGNGLFIVHCHNRGMWLREPGGWIRTAKSYYRSLRDSGWEHGDRIYPYRGLPSMFLHIFSFREMLEDFKEAGFADIEYLYLNATSSGPLKWSFWIPKWRAGGFLFAARSDSQVACGA